MAAMLGQMMTDLVLWIFVTMCIMTDDFRKDEDMPRLLQNACVVFTATNLLPHWMNTPANCLSICNPQWRSWNHLLILPKLHMKARARVTKGGSFHSLAKMHLQQSKTK
mmetsp:Transcript_15606/g.35728  ORF Transcript_15606/g.35728 Transcript_15606/m.35728 type:complete len:109 (-) Transcript_15606:127-453(-)